MNRAMISAAIAVISILAAPVHAETKPDNAVKYRHAVMDAMKGHVSAIALLAFNQVPDEGNYLKQHAESLANLGEELSLVFPEGSKTEGSHALPGIWEQPDKFSAAVLEAANATAALAEAVNGADRRAIAGAFRSVGESCKGCHESFREEHDDH